MRVACSLLALAAAVGVAAASPSASVVTSNGQRILSMPLTHAPHGRTPGSEWLASQAVLAAKNGTFPTGGSIWPTGVYWTTVEVGTPPVSFPVAIDSGSGDLDIEGAGCQGCNSAPPNNQYDVSKSSTGSLTYPYSFSNTYETCDLSSITAPCTISGKFYKDQVSIGQLGPVSVTFGSITSITTNFDQFKEVCGVMGLTGTDSNNVFSQLVSAGYVTDNVFALCMVRGSVSNGTLTFGGLDSRLHTGPFQWVPNAARGGFYEVALNGGITVDGASSPLSGVGATAILDTGTNILLLPTPAFESMRTTLETMCEKKTLAGVCDSQSKGGNLFDEKCFPLTTEQIDAFPDLTFGLADGVTLTMHGRDYLLAGDVRAVKQGDASLVCLAVRKTGEQGFLIVGDSLMRNYYLAFDRSRGMVGWAPVNKDNCGSV